MIISILAVLKAGSCYVPILPNENTSRIEYILKDDAIYSRFSARSLAIFNEKLTVDKMVGEYKKIYNR